MDNDGMRRAISLLTTTCLMFELAADRVHRAIRLDKPGGIDLVAFLLGGHTGADGGGDFGFRGAFAEHPFDVRFFEAEQTISEFAVRGDAEPIAAHAERFAD